MDFLSETNLSQKNGVAGIVSTSDWLKFMCLGFLNLIPILGSIIHIAILLFLVFSNDTAESVKSYIKASLFIAGIGLVLSLVVFIFCFVFVVGSF